MPDSLVTAGIDEDGYVVIRGSGGYMVSLTGREAEELRDSLTAILELDDGEHLLV